METVIAKTDERAVRVAESIYHFCIALMPVLYLFRVPVLNISLGTILLIVFIPHSLVYVLSGLTKVRRFAMIPFLVFYVYLIARTKGNLNNFLLCVATVINLWGIYCGSIKTERIRKIIECAALIFAALVFFQTLCYYALGMKLKMLPKALILDIFQESYVFRNDPGMYRPSAIFLEPSHFAQYCCFALISVLFPVEGKANLKKAAIIAAGCVLTTSGMGMAVTAGIIVWYVLFTKQYPEKKLLTIIGGFAAAVMAFVVLMQIPFFKTAVQRVFSTVDGYNAIQGRTRHISDAIGTMSGKTLLFGYGGNAEYPYYLAGLPDTIFKYGIIGTVLELMCFAWLMLEKGQNYVLCTSISFLALFCVAHLTSFYIQVFYFGLIIADVVTGNDTKRIRIVL